MTLHVSSMTREDPLIGKHGVAIRQLSSRGDKGGSDCRRSGFSKRQDHGRRQDTELREWARRALTAVLLVPLFHASVGAVNAEPIAMQLSATARAANAPLGFTVVDSRARVEADNFGKRIFWVSDDEILFVGYQTLGRSTEGRAAAIDDYQLRVWNIRTNTFRVVREFARSGPYPCFSDGHLLVRVREKGKLHTYYGDTSSIQRAEPDVQFHEVFCRPLQDVPRLPSWTSGRDVRWLEKEGAGFVDFGELAKGMESGPVRFYGHRSSEAEGTVLPVGRHDIKRSFSYYGFKDAFFVEGDYPHLPRPEGVPYPVYWLYRDGRLEKILNLPWGPWRSRGSSWPVPTKRGIVIVSHNASVRSASDLGHAGLYLVSSGTASKILTGWIQATAVSPNGCWLAFDFADRISRRTNVLKAMNLCEGMRG